MELRAGDRVRWTRNDPRSGLVNGEVATVERIEKDGVRFRLGDGSVTKLADGDPQLRHTDRAWAATVHAFQGKTVDRIVAAMPAGNPQLTNQQAFYVAISRARDRADLVTDDAWKLADQLEKATGERISALDATAKQAAHEAVFGRDPAHDRGADHVTRASDTMERGLGDEHDAHRDRVRERAGRESGKTDRGIDHDRSASRGLRRDSEHQKAAEPKHKSRDMDKGL